MAIQDDFTIDYVDRKITYSTAFVDGHPPNIYTVNELYSYLQDVFDEPAQMDDPVPMSAQTPTQYTLLNIWFMDNESMKALYGGSIQTNAWTKSGAFGITALRWQDAPTNAPDAGDIGDTFTGSSATGVVVAVDATRQVVWLRNTSAAQFGDAEAVTGTTAIFTTSANAGFNTGENIWANIFSVGSLQTETEVFVGQEDDQLGGEAYHDADQTDGVFQRTIQKLDEWWDSDVDFFTGSPNLLGGVGHIDLLVLTQELDNAIDGQRLAVFARQFSTVYSHFELTGGVGNFVVPFASTGADLNSADGCYNVGFDTGSGGKAQLDVGDVIENDAATPVGRLRAVVTAVTGTTSGDFDYYLIGENEANGSLVQFANNEDVKVRGDAFQFLIDTTTPVTNINGGLAAGISITFADAQVDVDEDSTPEEYACTIDCNSVLLATVYQRVQFLASRGNQDGTTTDTPDTLLPSGGATAEGSEFYRGVGDITFQYDGGVGTQPAEGDLVQNGTGAYGVVTSVTAGTTGTCVLTQVKGTWAEGEDCYVWDEVTPASNKIVINEPTTGPVSLTDNTAAPFGTFAGGRWFVAQGVVLINVPTADANNWETVDLDGDVKAPPTSRAITFAGMIVNDRAVILEVDTAGGIDVTKNQNGIGGAGAAIGDTTIPLDTTIALDVPAPRGFMRVVDVSDANGLEFRFEYTGITGTTVTLETTGTQMDGTCTSLGSSTVLNDTGQFTDANFGSDGWPKVGHEIRNVTDGDSRAVILRRIDDNSIETTPLTGGVSNDWANSDVYQVNRPTVALVDADTCYFGFIDGVVDTGTELAASIKFVGVTECVARMRFSDPDVGGQRVLPFELTNVQVTDADLTVTAIRNNDTIAA